MAKEAIENIYGISCSGENTGCDHETNPNIDQCLDCVYVRVRDVQSSTANRGKYNSPEAKANRIEEGK